MAKLTLSDLANLNNQTTAVNTINANSDATEAALEKTLSRDGTTPNAMEAQLDMNSNRIINLPFPVEDTDPIRLGDIDALDLAGADGATGAIGPQGPIGPSGANGVDLGQYAAIPLVINGNGTAIAAGDQADFEIPFACTISRWTLLADRVGSIQIDIWKTNAAGFPPTVANTITGSDIPVIVSDDFGQSTALTGWTTTISAGDTLRFHVNSANTIQRVTLSLKVTKT